MSGKAFTGIILASMLGSVLLVILGVFAFNAMAGWLAVHPGAAETIRYASALTPALVAILVLRRRRRSTGY